MISAVARNIERPNKHHSIRNHKPLVPPLDQSKFNLPIPPCFRLAGLPEKQKRLAPGGVPQVFEGRRGTSFGGRIDRTERRCLRVTRRGDVGRH